MSCRASAIPNFFHLIRTTGLRNLVVALFLALQSGLVLHQLEHDLTDHFGEPDHSCVITHNAAHTLPASEPTVVKLPDIAFVQQPVLPEAAVIARTTVTGFRSRAPPAAFSA